MEPVLAAVTAVIVDHCDPDEVVLFGSWAKGTTHRHSDIDVLVIGPFRESAWLRDREVREALRAFPIAIDLHCYTPGEYALEAAKPHTYLATSRATARTLYQRGTPTRE
jgi:predicted nucleotidyltransferase